MRTAESLAAVLLCCLCPVFAAVLQVLDRNVENLSGGELQRFAIAVVAAQKADVYMIDEPSSYLDVRQRLKAAKVNRGSRWGWAGGQGGRQTLKPKAAAAVCLLGDMAATTCQQSSLSGMAAAFKSCQAADSCGLSTNRLQGTLGSQNKVLAWARLPPEGCCACFFIAAYERCCQLHCPGHP